MLKLAGHTRYAYSPIIEWPAALPRSTSRAASDSLVLWPRGKPVAARKLPLLMHAGKVSAEVSSAFHLEYDSHASDAAIKTDCSILVLLSWIAD
jgi:hypothetical protein